MEVRKFAHLHGAPERIRALFVDIEGWPLWMPGVSRVEVLDRSGERLRAAVDQALRGRTARQIMEFRLSADGMRQIQLEGWFKKWDARWRFLEPPDGAGTTIALTVDLDLGFVGLLTPRSLVESTIDGIFRDVVGAARARLEDLRRLQPPGEGGEPGEVLLEIFEVAGGLEVVWGERRFALHED